MHDNISILLTKQRQFFKTRQTQPLTFRIEQLKKLQTLIQQHYAEITAALYQDLHKHETEAYITEISLVNHEIDFIIKKLKHWMQPKRKKSLFPICWPGRSQIWPEPYGIVFIMSPWNFPFYLTMMPLIGAMAAGNCIILKPSEIAPATQNVIADLINNHFSSDYCLVLLANAEETEQILKEKFDYIFYTGSTHIGKRVMQSAAQHLTPVTLELGGKSPCIIDQSANLDYAARRIMWGKFLNAGQTCIAPDYIYIHHTLKNAFVQKCQKLLIRFYGENSHASQSYGRIINRQHFDRLLRLLNQTNILFGGQTQADDLYIAPTLIDGVEWDHIVMQEEIFGPILPILTYEDLDDVITQINEHNKPLALYCFTNDRQTKKHILQNISFGGGCINDCLMQVSNTYLPFGGVGKSGIGGYHGEYSFKTFSHYKSIFIRSPKIDLPIAYPPYSNTKLTWLKRLLNLRFK